MAPHPLQRDTCTHLVQPPPGLTLASLERPPFDPSQ